MELGLFPLGIVLLPTERVPLHIFEPRYRELIGECIDEERDFGLVYADDQGVRELGTRARVDEVIERFDDGRMNVLVEGGERFRVERMTRGRSFMTAEVAPVDDEEAAQLSFRLAAQVELAPESKQELLELRSEQRRLEMVVELLDGVRQVLVATRELGERAKKNGSRL